MNLSWLTREKLIEMFPLLERFYSALVKGGWRSMEYTRSDCGEQTLSIWGQGEDTLVLSMDDVAAVSLRDAMEGKGDVKVTEPDEMDRRLSEYLGDGAPALEAGLAKRIEKMVQWAESSGAEDIAVNVVMEQDVPAHMEATFRSRRINSYVPVRVHIFPDRALIHSVGNFRFEREIRPYAPSFFFVDREFKCETVLNKVVTCILAGTDMTCSTADEERRVVVTVAKDIPKVIMFGVDEDLNVRLCFEKSPTMHSVNYMEVTEMLETIRKTWSALAVPRDSLISGWKALRMILSAGVGTGSVFCEPTGTPSFLVQTDHGHSYNAVAVYPYENTAVVQSTDENWYRVIGVKNVDDLKFVAKAAEKYDPLDFDFAISCRDKTAKDCPETAPAEEAVPAGEEFHYDPVTEACEEIKDDNAKYDKDRDDPDEEDLADVLDDVDDEGEAGNDGDPDDEDEEDDDVEDIDDEDEEDIDDEDEEDDDDEEASPNDPGDPYEGAFEGFMDVMTEHAHEFEGQPSSRLVCFIEYHRPEGVYCLSKWKDSPCPLKLEVRMNVEGWESEPKWSAVAEYEGRKFSCQGESLEEIIKDYVETFNALMN